MYNLPSYPDVLLAGISNEPSLKMEISKLFDKITCRPINKLLLQFGLDISVDGHDDDDVFFRCYMLN